MKILVSRLQGGNEVGGAERSAYLHWLVLNEVGQKTDIYSNAHLPGVKNSFVPDWKILRWVWTWVALPPKAWVGRYDVLNPHSREDQVSLTLSRWLHRTPVAWKDAGDLVHNIKLNRRGLLGRLNQHLLIAAIERADAIYTLDSGDRETILERLTMLGRPIDATKISVIPSDILFDDYDLTATPPKETDKLVIGTVVRLDEHKGVQYLLQAANQLVTKHQNLEFWVVGGGPYRPELEKIPSHDVDVTFWGHQDDVSPYLNGIDIFVQPAEFEGWGRNVKEAMYFGKAIAGSNVGGIAVQIEDGKTGLLFEPGNVNQLSEQIERLIEDKPLRERLGKAARAKALRDGDYVTLVKTKILPLFEEVLAKSRQ